MTTTRINFQKDGKHKDQASLFFEEKRFICSAEYDLVITLKDGKAIDVLEGDILCSEGILHWEEYIDKEDLLKKINDLVLQL